MNLDPYRAFMAELATSSGDFIRPYFGRADLRVELKADQSPVTAADRGAEELMRGMIRSTFPGHGIIGEELGCEREGADFTWVLDPIDGTKSFTASVPLFGTLIALLHEGQPVLGCIHQPILGLMLVGDGQTATLNGKAARTRTVARIEEATLLTSDPAAAALIPGFPELMGRAKLTRTWGDCYGHLLVATGWADAIFDPIMNLWDIAALVPIIRGAGGVITDSKGGPPYPATSTVAAGSAGAAPSGPRGNPGMNHIAWALVGMVGYSFTTLFVKLATRGGQLSSFMVLAIACVFTLASTACIVVARGDLQRLSARDLVGTSAWFAYATGIALTVAVTSLFRALSLGPASSVVPIYGMFIVGGAVLGILFLHEPLTARKLLGIGLAAASIVLLAKNP